VVYKPKPKPPKEEFITVLARKLGLPEGTIKKLWPDLIGRKSKKRGGKIKKNYARGGGIRKPKV